MSGSRAPRPGVLWLGRVAILTGTSGSGKTTACCDLVHRAPERGLSCAGLVCPGRFEGDRRVGIDVVDVRSGERRSSRPSAATAVRSDGPWSFDPAAITWARPSLAETVWRALGNPPRAPFRAPDSTTPPDALEGVLAPLLGT